MVFLDLSYYFWYFFNCFDRKFLLELILEVDSYCQSFLFLIRCSYNMNDMLLFILFQFFNTFDLFSFIDKLYLLFLDTFLQGEIFLYFIEIYLIIKREAIRPFIYLSKVYYFWTFLFLLLTNFLIFHSFAWIIGIYIYIETKRWFLS